MVSPGKSLSAATVTRYHKEDIEKGKGRWHGEIAKELGLKDPVTLEQFERLANGQHPLTGEQLIKWRKPPTDHIPAWVNDDKAWKEYLGEQVIRSLSDGLNPFTDKYEGGREYVPESPQKSRESPVSPISPERTDREKLLILMQEEARIIYARNLFSEYGAEERTYLDGRGVTLKSMAEFGVGLAYQHGTQIVETLAGYGDDLLLDSGLAKRSDDGHLYDAFRGRIMFPINDRRGSVIAFAGRAPDGVRPKFINSKETKLYSKSATLYNLDRALKHVEKSGKLIVVEGYMDAIAHHAAGNRNVVATCGTAMTPKQADMIAALSPHVILNHDNDSAGVKAAKKQAAMLIERGVKVEMLTFEMFKDAAKAMEKGGPAYLKTYTDNMTTSLLKWSIERGIEKHKTDDLGWGAKVALDTIETFSKLPPARREEFAREWTAYLGVPEPRREMPKPWKEHRAIVTDLTTSAPKTVSITAMVGGDENVFAAHRTAVKAMLDWLEPNCQARMGGDKEPVTTGKWICCAIEHELARPVEGYCAPHLHTHVDVFNLTVDEKGQARSVEGHILFELQAAATAVYQQVLAEEILKLGYEVNKGKNNAPDIAGYTADYVKSESQGANKIDARMQELDLTSRKAKVLIAHQNREPKPLDVAIPEILETQKQRAAAHGNQPAKVVEAAARNRGRERHVPTSKEIHAAVDFAVAKLSQMSSTFSTPQIIRDAMFHAQGGDKAEVEREIRAIRESGKLIQVHHIKGARTEHFTTPELVKIERENIKAMLEGRNQETATIQNITPEYVKTRYSDLNLGLQRVIHRSLATHDRYYLIQGYAGTRKTTGAIKAINELAKENGYCVVGLAPISSGVQALKGAGVEASTLQKHLIMSSANPKPDQPVLYILDEAGQASSEQIRCFMRKVRPQDRAIFCGDRKQHDPVEAGRPFGQFQDAGIDKSTANQLLRHKNLEVREIAVAMARGNVHDGVELLQKYERVTAIENKVERYTAIAKDFAASPEGTVIVTPDNLSRREINQEVRAALLETGHVMGKGVAAECLHARTMTRAEVAHAGSYQVNDRILYRGGSKVLKLAKDSYSTVVRVDQKAREITVKRTDGSLQTYNPERCKGVSVYHSEQIRISQGDHVQFTAQWKAKNIATRQTGVVSYIDKAGNIRVELDNSSKQQQTGRRHKPRVEGFNLKDFRHLDYAYTMTSHSIQGATKRRTLMNVETGNTRVQGLLGKTAAYVGMSRPEEDLRIFSDSADMQKLEKALSRETKSNTTLPEFKRAKSVGRGV